MIQLDDGRIFIIGGSKVNGSDSFSIIVDLNSETLLLEKIAENFVPSIPRTVIQLPNGIVLISGGTDGNGLNSFLATIDLNETIPQVNSLVSENFAPSTV